MQNRTAVSVFVGVMLVTVACTPTTSSTTTSLAPATTTTNETPLASSTTTSEVVSAARPADLILHNGQVLLIDDAFTVAEAIAIIDGDVAATGSSAEVLASVGPDTVVIDLAGRTVIPLEAHPVHW